MKRLVGALIALVLAGALSCALSIDPCQHGECDGKITIECVQIVLPTGTLTECMDSGAPSDDSAGDDEAQTVTDPSSQSYGGSGAGLPPTTETAGHHDPNAL